MKGIFFSIWRLPSAASILALVLLLGSCSNVDNVYDSIIQVSLSRGRRRVKEYAAWTYSMAGFIGSMLRGV